MSTKKFLKALGLIIVVALLAAALPLQAKAATLCVNPTGSDGCYASIQAAINAAAPGDTVQVEAGEYVEQLLIQKDLTLVGAGIGETIVKAPTTGRATAPGYTSQFYSGETWDTDYLLAAFPTDPVNDTPISVKVSGFTFDANGQAHTSGSDRFTGVYFRKVYNDDIAQAGLFNSEIKGFNTNDPSVTGIRVLESSKLTLSGNQVKDYTILGIVVYGTDNLVDPIVTTTGNTLTPAGDVEGIQYRYINLVGSEGFAGIIAENTINGGKIPISPAYSDNILVEDNVINNSADVGILLETSSFCTVRGNEITNSSIAGIVLQESSSCTVQENVITNFSGNGIQVAGSNHVIQGNIISDTTGHASNGITVLSLLFPAGSSGNQIIGNTISGIHSGDPSSLGNCGWGIGVDFSKGAVTNTTITGNTVTDNDAGVVFWGVDASNVAHYNKIYDNSPYDLGNSNASVTIDAKANWWGAATGPTLAKISGNVNYNPWCYNEACTELFVAEGGSIQDAIDAAPEGGIVHVAAGTYVENISIPAGKQLNFIGEVDEEGNPLPVIKGTLSASNLTGKTWLIENLNFVDNGEDSISLNSGGNLTVRNCTFDGAGRFMNGGNRAIQASGSSNQLTVENSTFQNGWYVSVQGYYTSLNVSNSTFTNVKSGINVQGAAGNTVTIDNTDFSVIAQGVSNDTYGVRFASSSPSGKDLTITNSSFIVNKNDIVAEPGTYHSAIIIRSGATGALKVENSSILGEVVNLTASNTLDASPNWWGSVAGPAEGQIEGNVTYDPWCGDAACSFLVSATEPAESGFYVKDGKLFIKGHVNIPGGIELNEPGLTVVLEDGAVIQNDSPCFVVAENNITITSETPGSLPKCVPTDGDHGIVVNDGVSGVRIVGLEITGIDPVTEEDLSTGDGIHFNGAITNFQIVNNYIHDLDGDGVFFTAQPTGEPMEIQGNLFQNNGGLGVNAGTFEVNAEYNSWGDIDGPEGTNGDGISENVVADPWTHVDLYMTATPWADKAANGKQFTVTVKANLKNVYGASFKLNYDKTSLEYISVVEETVFDPVPEHETRVTVDETNGVISYDGVKTGSVSGSDVVLFTLTFEAKDNGDATLTFDTTTDLFAMSYPITTTNIYAANLEDLSLDLFDLPTIDSADIQGYYLSGEERGFSVVLTNPSEGGDFAHVYVDYMIANATMDEIDSIMYSVDGGDTWVALGVGPGTSYGEDDEGNIVGYFGKINDSGFPLAPNTSLTTLFQVTFKTREQGDTNYPTSYDISMSLKDADTDPVYELDAFTATAEVYDKPAFTSDTIAGPYLGGVEREFDVTLTNPSTGIETNVLARFTLYSLSPDDILSIYYWETADDSWHTLPLTVDGSNLVGTFGPSDGFPMSSPYNATSQFKVTFANDLTGTFDYSIELFDVEFEPERSLTKLEGTGDIFANYTIEGIFSMQGRVFRGGIPVTLTSTTVGFPYGPWTEPTSDVLGINWLLNNVAISEYLITTNQPRYLNLTEDSEKTITVDGAKTLNALMLRGGNVVDDEVIDVNDASLIGTNYGVKGEDNVADANFDEWVNIQDLALVGGNFDLTSATAYASWTP